MIRLTRTTTYLIQRGAEVTDAEREAYESRKKELMSKLSQVVH
jgi:hypothetical protein